MHYPLFDYQGIFCNYVCSKCEREAKSKYTPQTFSGYSQADIDEPIEPEPETGPAGQEWWR